MFSPKIKVDRALLRRIESAAEKAGYASAEEFVIHVLEREVARLEESGDQEQVRKQLRGLGYIE